jgi:hypothetical protein
MLIFLCLVALVPIGLFVVHLLRTNDPAQQWPILATTLKLSFDSDPSRITGDWGGRRVQIIVIPSGVTVTMWLKRTTGLRVECAPKDVVAKRSPESMPTAVPVLDEIFGRKYVGLCSDPSAAGTIFDAALQIRVSDMEFVDFVGAGSSVIWSLPSLKKQAEAESVLVALTTIAESLERVPAGA